MQTKTSKQDESVAKGLAGLVFKAVCARLGFPEVIPEYVFAPPRKWRFDYAFPSEKLAVEIQGGIFIAGRHVRGAALVREYEKLNAAAIMGYRILYVTPKQFASGEVLALIEKALKTH